MMHALPERVIRKVVERALAEDVGPGDITTLATVNATATCTAQMVAKAEGIVAGLELARAVFARLDPGVAFQARVQDGEQVRPGTAVAGLSGRTRAILTGERTALNFVQRMSGIATLTARYVEAVRGTGARICDTRKTAPGLRFLDKYAVAAGGGHNHRVGLFDGILVKDNHIRAAGGLEHAMAAVRARAPHLLRVEVEAQSLEQVEEAARAGADVIMLDNMSPDEVRQAVTAIAGRAQTEVSGGVNLETVRAYAKCGVDYISVGALTHSAPALDLSLEITGP